MDNIYQEIFVRQREAGRIMRIIKDTELDSKETTPYASEIEAATSKAMKDAIMSRINAYVLDEFIGYNEIPELPFVDVPAEQEGETDESI